jgi:hypothetical protein
VTWSARAKLSMPSALCRQVRRISGRDVSIWKRETGKEGRGGVSHASTSYSGCSISIDFWFWTIDHWNASQVCHGVMGSL